MRRPRTGSAGLNVANQIYDRFQSAGKALNEGDIAIVDAAEYHYYQVRIVVASRHSITVTYFPRSDSDIITARMVGMRFCTLKTSGRHSPFDVLTLTGRLLALASSL